MPTTPHATSRRASGSIWSRISPNGTPPVCKIMDYGRYKYELKKKAATAKRSQHQSQLKEIKLRPQIDEHDLAFKLRAAERFLIAGDKVKATVTFRGREIMHQQVGRDLLDRVVKRLSEIAKAESSPHMEGRMLSLIVAPDRRGQTRRRGRARRLLLLRRTSRQDLLDRRAVGRDDQREHASFHVRRGLRLRDLGQPLHDAIEQVTADLLVHDLTAAERHGRLHLVAIDQETLRRAQLEREVVLVDLGPELDLLQLALVLGSLRSRRLLLQLVLVAPVIHDLAHGRRAVRRDLDQVESDALRDVAGGVRRHHAELLPFLVHHTHLGNTDRPVHPDLVFLGRYVAPTASTKSHAF